MKMNKDRKYYKTYEALRNYRYKTGEEKDIITDFLNTLDEIEKEVIDLHFFHLYRLTPISNKMKFTREYTESIRDSVIFRLSKILLEDEEINENE